MKGRAMGRRYRLRHTRRSEHPHQEVINNELFMFRSEVRISEKLLNCCCELLLYGGREKSWPTESVGTPGDAKRGNAKQEKLREEERKR